MAKPVAPPAAIPAPPWWPAAVAFVAALAVYAVTCARTVTLVDSGELILVCATFGVAHPPGFPVYTLVGYLFSLLPIGSVAFRLALMSGFFAAVTAALVALVVGEVVAQSRASAPARQAGRLPPQRRAAAAGEAPAGGGKLRPYESLPQLAAALCLAYSVTLWSYAVVAEVYTLNLALLLGALWLVLVWRRLGAGSGRLALAAGLLYGLGLGVHHVTIVLAGPALLLLVLVTAGWRWLASRQALLTAAGVACGLLTYLQLPLAAAAQPVLAWGEPTSWERFWWHITARQYQVNLFAGDAGVVLENLRYFLALLWRQLTPLALLPAVFGVPWLWRRQRAVLWSLLLLVALGLAYGVNYEIAEDSDAYFLTTFVVLAVLVGVGLRFFLELARARRSAVVAVVTGAALLAALNLGLHYRANDRSQDLIARHFVEDALFGVGPDGLLLTLDWQLFSPYLYLRHVEGFRTDATVVDVNLMRRTWYVDRYLRRTYPQLMEASDEPARAFVSKLLDWEYGRPHDPEELTRLFVRLINSFVDSHLPAREAHLTLPMEPGVGTRWLWVPHGLTMKLEPGREPLREPEPVLHVEPLLRDSSLLHEVVVKKVRPYYGLMAANRARFLTMVGDFQAAREHLDLALRLYPESGTSYQILGDLEATQGRVAEARAAYERSLRLDPGNRETAERLRRLDAQTGR